MENYKVDVPVTIFIWTRPDYQRRQFEVIKKAKPSILLLISDGGRNSTEWENIQLNRNMFEEEIDWQCTIYKLYEETNNGMYTMGKKCFDFVWSHVEYSIFLEDDIIPSVSFFPFCAELLKKYKNDTRICSITGNNQLESWDKCPYDYFFSKEASISGFAMWRRSFEYFYDFSLINNQYNSKLFFDNLYLFKNKNLRKQTYAFTKHGVYEGHVDGTEYWLSFMCYGQNQLHIVSKKNMITNIGFEGSEHIDVPKRIPKGIRRLFNMKSYDVSFPLNCPSMVLADLEYEKQRNRALGYNEPLILLGRKISRILLVLISGDIRYFVKKIKLNIGRIRNHRMEK